MVNPDNAEAIVNQWADVQGLPRTPSFRDEVDGCPREVWRDAAGRPVLESYFLPGLGHGTPIRTSGGEDACGAPGPFILEAGVSSSYRVAQFWGLAASPATTAAGAARSQDRTARPSSSRSREAARPAAANVLPPLNPQKIISGALKAAGLLKD